MLCVDNHGYDPCLDGITGGMVFQVKKEKSDV